MNVMKPSLTISPCVLESALHHIRVCTGLSFATKRIGPPCCTLFTFVTCCSLQIILSQNNLLPTISVLSENTLLKTTCHFLLLLVGFDTLPYRKDYDRSPILVGHQPSPSYWNFVMNYSMQGMTKMIPELFLMLKSMKVEIKKEHQVLMIHKITSF